MRAYRRNERGEITLILLKKMIFKFIFDWNIYAENRILKCALILFLKLDAYKFVFS